MMTCEACEKVLVDALYDVLESAQQKQLDRHLESCRNCRELSVELQAASRALEENGLRANGVADVPEPALSDLWDNIQPALDQADAERYRQISRPSRFAPYLIGALATAASLLLFVLLFDPGTQLANPATETAQTASSASASNADLMNYLRRVEIMLMAVANAQDRNGAGVPVRQALARTLSQEAGVLVNRMDGNFSSGQVRLLKDIEFMLMQIANLEEGNMDEGVRLLQGYIETNNILFRIRLIDMRESETII